ncbi:hypothetical protein [Alistipes putredinis]|jgi:hypothetical protein
MVKMVIGPVGDFIGEYDVFEVVDISTEIFPQKQMQWFLSGA